MACSTAFAEFFLAQTLEAFQRLHPKLRIELVKQLDDFRASSLIEHRIDLVCCVLPEAPESVVAIRLGTTQSVVCADDAVLARFGVPKHPRELPESALIPGGIPGRWILTRAGEQVIVSPQGPMTFPNAHLVLQSALRSGGFALLPYVAAKPHLESGRLHRVLHDWQAPELPIMALLPSRTDSDRRLSRLLDFLRLHLAEGARDCSAG